MTDSQLQPSTIDAPQLPEVALQAARELQRFYSLDPAKPYTASVLADCIALIDRLTRLCDAYQGQVEAGAARIAELEKALQDMVDTFRPFTGRPVGAPHSAARIQQDHEIGVRDRALRALRPHGLARTPGESL